MQAAGGGGRHAGHGADQSGLAAAARSEQRANFPAREAGTRVSIALTATMLGMALGGWMTGVIFDLTGSYDIAFLNGLAWNFMNLSIATFLLLRARGKTPRTQTAAA